MADAAAYSLRPRNKQRKKKRKGADIALVDAASPGVFKRKRTTRAGTVIDKPAKQVDILKGVLGKPRKKRTRARTTPVRDFRDPNVPPDAGAGPSGVTREVRIPPQSPSLFSSGSSDRVRVTRVIGRRPSTSSRRSSSVASDAPTVRMGGEYDWARRKLASDSGRSRSRTPVPIDLVGMEVGSTPLQSPVPSRAPSVTRSVTPPRAASPAPSLRSLRSVRGAPPPANPVAARYRGATPVPDFDQLIDPTNARERTLRRVFVRRRRYRRNPIEFRYDANNVPHLVVRRNLVYTKVPSSYFPSLRPSNSIPMHGAIRSKNKLARRLLAIRQFRRNLARTPAVPRYIRESLRRELLKTKRKFRTYDYRDEPGATTYREVLNVNQRRRRRRRIAIRPESDD